MTFSRSKTFWLGCVAGAAPILVTRAFLLLGIGSWASMGWSCIVAFLALVVASCASILEAWLRARAAASATAFAAFGLFLGIVFAEIVGQRLRMRAFVLATRRAAPIVEAVERFEQQNGRPPGHLRELVPEFLDELPSRIPPLEIHVGGPPTSRWILRAHVGGIVSWWDQLLYLADRDFDGYGGRVQPLGPGWGYLHHS